MALSVETGLLTAGIVLSTTTVSCGFTGKVIILFTTGQTVEGNDSAANASWSMGFSDSTNHCCISWASDDNVGTTNCGKTMRTTAALEILSDGTPTSVITVSDVNFAASSFDVVFSGIPLAAYKIGYMLIGGADITNVKVGSHTMANSTGDKSETGVGFEGDFGIFLFSAQTADGTAVRANASLGFVAKVNDAGTSRARQFGMCWGVDDAVNMTATIDAVSYTNSTNFLTYILDGAETVDVLAQFGTASVPLGFASDGFRYNISNASATNAQLLLYCIIKGGQWDVGISDTNTDITGMAFQPKGVFAAHTETTADATVTINARSIVGAAASTTTEAAAGANHQDAQLNTNVGRNTASSSLLTQPGVAATIVLDSLDAAGWSISASGGTYSSPAKVMGWFAMGDNAAAPISLVFTPPTTAMMPYLVR